MLKKICPICNKSFFDVTTNGNRKYCCLKCKYQAQTERNKLKKYPKIKCPECGHSIQLDFFPKVRYTKFIKLKCPKCGNNVAFSSKPLDERVEEFEKFEREKEQVFI